MRLPAVSLPQRIGINVSGGFVVREEITKDARRLFTRQNSGACMAGCSTMRNEIAQTVKFKG